MEDIRKVKLFPNYFKKIGLIIIVLDIIAYIILLLNLSQLGGKLYFGIEIWAHVLILALFFIVFAKEKVEDERIMQIRYKVMTYSMYIGVVLTLLMTLINQTPSFSNIENFSNYEHYEARNLVTIILLLYIVYFNIEKRR